jgi:hypothetical protein
MDASTVSVSARALRSRLASSMTLPEAQILIGNPAGAAQVADGQGGKQFINIFFYRIEQSGYPADGPSDDPSYLRIYCLVTAFGSEETSGAAKVTAGENDLRLIGGVVASLHQRPVMTVTDEASGIVVTLEIVPAPFTIESIYSLWSTQASTAYRPSVAYELALLPDRFAGPAGPGQRVGEIVLGVDAIPRGSGGDSAGVGVGVGVAAAPPPDWIPEVRFAVGDGLQQTLVLGAAEVPATLDVALAGKVGASVTLRWTAWTPSAGWGPPIDAAGPPLVIDSRTLDGAGRQAVALPAAGAGARRQLTLAAFFTRTLPSGDTAEVSSNLLLLSVFEEWAP